MDAGLQSEPGLSGRRHVGHSDARLLSAAWWISTPSLIRKGIARDIEQRRLFILLPFGMLLGLALYAGLPVEPGMSIFVSGSLIALLLLASALHQRSMIGLRLGLQLLFFWAGFCLLPLYGQLNGTAMLGYPAYGTYTMVVDEILPASEGAARAIVSRLEPVADARSVPIRRARLVLPKGVVVEGGDSLQAALRLAPIPGPILPGAYDGQFHSYFSGIGAYGSVTSGLQVLDRPSDVRPFQSIDQLRASIGRRIHTVLHGATAAIAEAMVVGTQSAITDDIRDVMAASGLAHIYSISGLHLSIVAGGIFWLVRLVLASLPLTAFWPVKKLAAITGIVAAFLYLLLAGGLDNVPAFRSTLMLALIFGAVLAGRQALTMRNVAIAAIVIILIDPASIFRPSFQLSFAAVVGLIGIFELPRFRTDQQAGRLRRMANVVAATAWTSLVAGLATLLFSAYHFQQTAPLGVLGNVLALPFVSLVIMPFGVFSVLAMPFGADAPFLLTMGWGIDRMIDVANLVAAGSAGWTGNPLLSQWTLLLGLVALAWFAFLASPWRLLGPLAALVLILAFGLETRPDIIIADTTQAVAVRDDDGMALVSGRTGSFAVDAWSDHFQLDIAPNHTSARCDGLACIVTRPEYTMALVRNAAAFAEDCGRHDLVIARIYPPALCFDLGTVIGPSQLARGGVHMLAWNATTERFDIRPAIVSLNRPWRVSPR